MNDKLGKFKICVPDKSNIRKLGYLKNDKLKAAFQKKFLWPAHSILNIYFMNDGKNIDRQTADQIQRSSKSKIDPLQYEVDKIKDIRECIKKIINERFAPIINLEFNVIDNIENSQIRIDFDELNGSWSYVGIDCNNHKKESTMNFAWFDVQTVMHEFGHALGLIHEHQNPKNNTIKWDDKAVYKWAQVTQGWDKQTTKINIIEPPTEQINGSEYDPLSIMLYFYPPELTLDNKGTSENLRLSPYDVIYLNNTYTKTVDLDIFYNKIYGESIKKQLISDSTNKKLFTYVDKKTSKYMIFTVFIIITIVLFIIFYFVFIKKSNPQMSSYQLPSFYNK